MINLIKETTSQILREHYNLEISQNNINISQTKPEFDGDYTIVVFEFTKFIKSNPAQIAELIGNELQHKIIDIINFNVIKGFLNIKLSNKYWLSVNKNFKIANFINAQNSSKIIVEFLSPNTNKPLHLGHVRNALIGESLSEILKFTSNQVSKVCLYNNRGIHICQSMLAWKLWNKDKTPQQVNKKGDHFIGDLYVQYHNGLKKEINEIVASGKTEDEAKNISVLANQTKELLRMWEKKEQETVNIWKKLNDWVLEGFNETMQKLGISFDKFYFESDIYEQGKNVILDQLNKKVVYKKADNSISIDLTDCGLDEKVLLRADGTSVYITQDIGTIIDRYKEFTFDKHIYVVGNEQEYHFKVLKEILHKFGYDWYDKLVHYSYGMIELPEGKMKSREGKVVDADDLIEEMIETARQMSEERSKIENMSKEELDENIRKIALGALKYHILKIDPKRNIMFNPAESIDFNGNTGPFIQYTCTRINTLINKYTGNLSDVNNYNETIEILPIETKILRELSSYTQVVSDAADTLNPALIANYLYNLAKMFNNFYQEIPIFKEEIEDKMKFRIKLSNNVADTLKKGLNLLGIEIPTKM